MSVSGRRDCTMRVVLLAIVCFVAAVGERPPRGFKRAVAPQPGSLRWLQLLATDFRVEGDGKGVEGTASRSAAAPAPTFPLQAIPFEIPTGAVGGTVKVLLLPVPIPAPQSNQRGAVYSYKTYDFEGSGLSRGLPGAANNVEPQPQLQPANLQQPDQNQGQQRFPGSVRIEQFDGTLKSPYVDIPVSSKKLLEKFIAQQPTAPELPPAVLSGHDFSERILRPEYEYSVNQPQSQPSKPQPFSTNSPSRGREPSRPQVRRALLLEGMLRVPRSDYTERYVAWWDASSGAARVDFHGGSTSTFRWAMPDGAMQRLEMRVDRTGVGDVRRCGVVGRSSIEPAQRAHPALPDFDLFSFAGFVQSEEGRAERWTHATESRGSRAAGEERLTFNHELLLTRSESGVLPMRYAVSVDSSMLGPATDGYEHRYVVVREINENPEFFTPNIDDMCDSVEALNVTSADHIARVEPLKEFTMPQRDPRYDEAFERFKAEYNRQYADATEEVMRKNVFIQHMRFIESGNREGATFQMGVNFFGDRLSSELDKLLGVERSRKPVAAETFPYSRSRLNAEQARLPRTFDWRPRGAVSPVRSQGLTCSSCWAISVAGAVEGALFVRTRQLTPLSEKTLVDCAKPFGGNGCEPTYPSNAYDYVHNLGLPALQEYPPYKPQEDTCAADRVQPVTRISSYVDVLPNSVPALQIAIRNHAPTVVIINAKPKTFLFYKKGVLYDDRCAKSLDTLIHAVLAVGWGDRKGEPYFIIKNSWSEKWGDEGYARLQARANTCGVLDEPSYPRLEHSDVVRAPTSERR